MSVVWTGSNGDLEMSSQGLIESAGQFRGFVEAGSMQE